MITELLKKIAFWALAGAVFGVTATVAGLYTLQYWTYEKMNAPSEYELFQKEQESKMGKSCIELYDEAIAFVNKSVKPVIAAGREGKDWLSLVDKEMLNSMKTIEKNAYMCSHTMMQSKDEDEIKKGKSLRSFFMLYNTLYEHTVSYTGEPVKISDLKPGSFKITENIYQDVIR